MVNLVERSTELYDVKFELRDQVICVRAEWNESNQAHVVLLPDGTAAPACTTQMREETASHKSFLLLYRKRDKSYTPWRSTANPTPGARSVHVPPAPPSWAAQNRRTPRIFVPAFPIALYVQRANHRTAQHSPIQQLIAVAPLPHRR